jgi:hypothetical protein
VLIGIIYLIIMTSTLRDLFGKVITDLFEIGKWALNGSKKYSQVPVLNNKEHFAERELLKDLFRSNLIYIFGVKCC